MSMRFRKALVPILPAVVAAAVSALPAAGCGGSEPPPLTKEEFTAAKQEREVIIQKEYGQRAFDKGAGKKAPSK
jgi:hypothetical protein